MDRDSFYLYASGRSALFHGVSCLPKNSSKRILVPFYHCGVEVQAILRAGFDVVFYPLKDTLEIDFLWLEENVSSDIAAILIVHFFGFPQPLEKIHSFCRRNQLVLIEDCAHALYSSHGETLLGTSGDIAVFSLMKTVGLPNGGGLLIKNRQFAAPRKGKSFFNRALLKKSIRSFLEFEANRNHKKDGWAAKILRYYDKQQMISTYETSQVTGGKCWYYEVPQYHYHHAISCMSMWFLRPLPVAEIIKKRRENYSKLLKRVSWCTDMHPLFGQCGKGVCPLCLPVRVENSDDWVEKLGRKQIFPFVFGRFPHPSFQGPLLPKSRTFQQGILGLPVHQQLGNADIHEIAYRLNTLLRAKE